MKVYKPKQDNVKKLMLFLKKIKEDGRHKDQ